MLRYRTATVPPTTTGLGTQSVGLEPPSTTTTMVDAVGQFPSPFHLVSILFLSFFFQLISTSLDFVCIDAHISNSTLPQCSACYLYPLTYSTSPRSSMNSNYLGTFLNPVYVYLCIFVCVSMTTTSPCYQTIYEKDIARYQGSVSVPLPNYGLCAPRRPTCHDAIRLMCTVLCHLGFIRREHVRQRHLGTCECIWSRLVILEHTRVCTSMIT